jgi:peptidoglycan/LPS O-acetylase OafA/YrhL
VEPSEGAARRFRPEIEGLRAVAATLVAVYHIFFGRVSGGVDVFFVVSGFLITTSLLRQVEQGGHPDLVRFLSRLMARLLPLALVVLGAAAVGIVLILPVTRQASALGEVVASATYWENWMLALKAVDYAAQDEVKSPVQHFWALSVQGQFYLLWFALVSGTLVVAGRRRFRLAMGTVFGVVLVVSLAVSILLTEANQPLAYFHTGTRMWEFAAGGLLAMTIGHLEVRPRPLAPVMGWVGLALIVSCGLVLDVSTMFPGFVAVWPVAAALLVLMSGGTRSRWSVDRLLGSRPFVAAGGIAYALYLVHWPLLVFVQTVRERTGPAELPVGLAILLASVILAIIGTRLVASPASGWLSARWPGRRVMWAGAGSIALVAAGAFALASPVLPGGGEPLLDPAIYTGAGASVSRPSEAPHASTTPGSSPGAEPSAGNRPSVSPAPSIDPHADQVPFGPDLRTIGMDRGHFYHDGCLQKLTAESLILCTGGSRDGSTTVMVVGGSHSLHWLPAIEPVARERGWRMITALKADCPMSAGPFGDDDRQRSCEQWNRSLIQRILADPPDLLITTSTITTPRGEDVPAGYVERWNELAAAGIPVVGIRDTPRASSDRPDCLARHRDDPWACDIDRSPTLDPVDPASLVEDRPSSLVLVDMSGALCSTESCPAVIGHVVVYRDAHHLSATFAQTMSRMLAEVLPQLP